jgi:iron complex outermembrane receptor protein
MCSEDKERMNDWRNGFAHLVWNRVLSETSSLRVTAGMDQEFYRANFVAEQFPAALPVIISAPLDFGGKSLRQNLEVQRTDIWGSNLRTVVGGELLREEVRAPWLFSTNDSISARQWRVFGGVEWKPGADWIINTGGMWEKHSMGGSIFAPRLAINYHATPEQTLRAVSTQSFRMPSILMFRALSTLQLSRAPLLLPQLTVPLGSVTYAAATGTVQPESVISNELGYLGEFHRLGLKVDVRAFVERINQRIGSDPPGYGNSPGPKIQGLEYQFDWKPFAATRIVFAEAQMRESPGRDHVIEYIETPHRTGSLALYQKLPGGFDLSLIHYYATPYAWYGNQVLDGIHQLDARLAYEFHVGATRGEVAVTAKSIDGSHMEYFRTQMYGRRAFASLRLDF